MSNDPHAIHLVEFLDEFQILSRQFTLDYMRKQLSVTVPVHNTREQWYALFLQYLREQKVLSD